MQFVGSAPQPLHPLFQLLPDLRQAGFILLQAAPKASWSTRASSGMYEATAPSRFETRREHCCRTGAHRIIRQQQRNHWQQLLTQDLAYRAEIIPTHFDAIIVEDRAAFANWLKMEEKMRLATEFIRLPYLFDVERLSHEVLAFDPSEWLPHVQDYAGNTSIPLISVNGGMNDEFNGPMKPTEMLERSPYIKQVLASFDEVFGRSRLMGLAAHCNVPEHRDVNYHWYNRVRIHIPVITHPSVLFYCGDKQVHMAAGEAWIFDSWKRHHVENNWEQQRVHLVIDTSGSARFWETVDASEWRCAKVCNKPANIKDRYLAYEEGKQVTILTENFNAPLVMHPGEIDALIADIIYDMRAFRGNSGPAVADFERTLARFRSE